MTREDICDTIEEEVLSDLETYAVEHPKERRVFLKNRNKYLRNKEYTSDAADIAVVAAANAFRVNFIIFREVSEKIGILKQPCREQTSATVYLRHKPMHYDVILDYDEDPDLSAPVLHCSYSTPNTSFIPPTRVSTPSSTSHSDSFIDNDSERRAKVEQALQGRPRQEAHKKHYFKEASVYGVEAEQVSTCLWEINGNKVYRVRVAPNQWLTAAHDGRHFKMNDTSRMGFSGRRRIGKCEGSFVCPNSNCPKLTTEGIVNKCDFYKRDKKAECKICHHYSVRVFCGCMKVEEYNPRMETLVICHEGKHICTPKPNVSSTCKYIQENVNLMTSQTPDQMSFDLVSYYLNIGDASKVFEAAKMMGSKRQIEKLK